MIGPHTEAAVPTDPTPRRPAPTLASGVEVLGPWHADGYLDPPHLARRADGQIVQLSALLAAVLRRVDGRRDHAQIAAALVADGERALHPDDVGLLLRKLAPLGLLAGPDGRDPELRRRDPLLGLRGRIKVLGPTGTRRVTTPFLWLFRPRIVVAVVAAFVATTAWAVGVHGVGSALEQAVGSPTSVLALVGLIVASAAFHEIGHAAACRYGGGEPSAIGAAVYLIWPAFYTDVTDAYRLPRRDRLRVDAGGLYFNAVFGVAAAAAWLVLRHPALLLLLPVQALQMARQLLPFVRFDGYHLLADLAGVPDLFAHLRPTLRRLVPWARREPSPLTPRARRIVAAWTLAVVPVLAGSLVLLVRGLPALFTGSLAAVGQQLATFLTNAGAGRVAAALLGLVTIAFIGFVPVSVAYLLARLAHRAGQRFWSATEDRPGLRTAGLATATAALVLAGPGVVPTSPADIGSASANGRELAAEADGDTLLVGLAAPVERRLVRGRTAPGSTTRAVFATPSDTRTEAAVPTPVDAADPAETAPAPTEREEEPALPNIESAPSTTDSTWPFSFPAPPRPGPGDHQVLVVNATDGASVVDVRAVLLWATGSIVDQRNEAWALASCTACSTVAGSLQVIVVEAASIESQRVAPQNISVAVNERCDTCRTSAVARQLVVTVEGGVPVVVRDRLAALVDAAEGAARLAATSDLRRIFADYEAAALRILDPWVVDADRTGEPAQPEPGAGTSPSGEAEEAPSPADEPERESATTDGDPADDGPDGSGGARDGEQPRGALGEGRPDDDEGADDADRDANGPPGDPGHDEATRSSEPDEQEDSPSPGS